VAGERDAERLTRVLPVEVVSAWARPVAATDEVAALLREAARFGSFCERRCGMLSAAPEVGEKNGKRKKLV
jgi:hypothetical protein